MDREDYITNIRIYWRDVYSQKVAGSQPPQPKQSKSLTYKHSGSHAQPHDDYLCEDDDYYSDDDDDYDGKSRSKGKSYRAPQEYNEKPSKIDSVDDQMLEDYHDYQDNRDDYDNMLGSKGKHYRAPRGYNEKSRHSWQQKPSLGDFMDDQLFKN